MARRRLGTNYTRLWSAAAVSNLGDGVTLAAIPLLAASLTRDPNGVAAVAFAGSLPWLLFALVGGAIADRRNRRLTMSIVDGLRMVAMGILAVAVLLGEESLWLMGIVAFALGSAETVFDNAAQAILPSIVAKDQLETANGRLYSAEIVGQHFAGPPIGAFLFGAAAAAPFLLDAASFGLAALLVLFLHGSFRPPPRPGTRAERRKRTMRADIAEGIRWLRSHRLLRLLAIVLGIVNLVESATMAIFVLYALEELGLSQGQFGLLLTAGAVGGLAGSIVAPSLSARLGPGRLLVAAVAVTGAATMLPGIWVQPMVVVIALALNGLFGVAWNVVTVSLRQTIVPDDLLGRVNSAYRLMGWGTMPLGALLGGALAEAFGLRVPFLAGGATVLLISLALVPEVTNRRLAEARAGVATGPLSA